VRCFFHLISNDDTILDDAGIEVRDIQTAWSEAIKAIHEMRQEFDGAEEDWRGWHLNVADDDGHVLFVMPLDMPIQ
jgi:hypothetical protein